MCTNWLTPNTHKLHCATKLLPNWIACRMPGSYFLSPKCWLFIEIHSFSFKILNAQYLHIYLSSAKMTARTVP